MNTTVRYAFVLMLLGIDASAQRPVHLTSNACFKIAVPPADIPPIRQDMSREELASYRMIDSLCCSLSGPNALDTLLGSFSSADELRPYLAAQYHVTNYNSLAHYEYLLTARNVKKEYNLSPSAIEVAVQGKAGSILPDSLKKLIAFASSAAIMHVKIKELTFDVDTHASSYDPFRVGCVTAQVVSTIKGKNLSSICDSWAESEADPCIRFTYPVMWTRGPDKYGCLEFAVCDSLGWPISCDDCYGANAFEVGREYVVVLKNMYVGFDGTTSYQNLLPFNWLEKMGGVFPIENGHVDDPHN
ncbi:MAG TPA: hypothetical protein VFH43_04590, partial [Candidatus Kapabacteria bacterium]|nr:hypothetical protein [Candidatus Kapabacteria bacterium]